MGRRRILMCPRCQKRKKGPGLSYCRPCHNFITASWFQEKSTKERAWIIGPSHKSVERSLDKLFGK